MSRQGALDDPVINDLESFVIAGAIEQQIGQQLGADEAVRIESLADVAALIAR
jgi:hypothetical protein